jgi:glycogen synthase
MKILMTTDTKEDKWQFTLNLVSSLCDENIEVVLLAMGPKLYNHQLEELENLAPNTHFYHQSITPEWKENDLTGIPKAGIWINKIFASENPDIIHLNHYSPACIHWDVPVVLSPQACIMLLENLSSVEELPEKFHKIFHMSQIALHAADAVVFPTAALLAHFTCVYGQISKAHVIPPGIREIYRPSDQKFPMVFSEGHLDDPNLNLNLLLLAAPYIDGEIFIAGEKEQVMRLPKNVRFLGNLSRQQKSNWLKMASIFALPARLDPFGLAFLEAASNRCALIGGDTPYLKEIWGDAMEYVSIDNPDALAAACNEGLHFPHKALAHGENAFSRVQKFNQRDIAIQYKELYLNLLQNHKKPPSRSTQLLKDLLP